MLNYPFKYLEDSVSVSINPESQGKALMGQFSSADKQRFDSITSEAKKEEFLWSRSALHNAGADLKYIEYSGKNQS